MNNKSVVVFKSLLKKGYISKYFEQESYLDFMNSGDIQYELFEMGKLLDFDIHKAGGKVYLIPHQDNEIFSQSNAELKETIGSEAKNIDLYLNNYIIMYFLYLMYNSKNNSIERRDFITIDDLIEKINCKMDLVSKNKDVYEEEEKLYSLNFIKIAETWLGKQYGDVDSKKYTDRIGCVRRAMIKMRNEELITISDSNNKISPTEKLDDLMPYFLGQNRVDEIRNFFKGEEEGEVTNAHIIKN